MKLQVLGNPQNVTSAYLERLVNGMFQLVINTTGRNHDIANRGSSLMLLDQFPNTRAPEHVCFEVSGPLEVDGVEQSEDSTWQNRSELVLVAENDQEVEVLRGIPYENYCKGQLLVLFLDRAHADKAQPVVHWAAEDLLG